MTMANDIDICLLDIANVDAAQHVIDESFRRYLALIDKTPDRDGNPYDYLAQAASCSTAWVAKIDGGIAGVAQVRSTSAVIWQIDIVGVLERFAKRGIGLLLMQRIEQDARAHNIERLTLTTLARARWLVEFYDRLGFMIDRRGPPSHGLDAFARVYMAKEITV